MEHAAQADDPALAHPRRELAGRLDRVVIRLALDEPGEDDETSEDNGLTLCINKELAEKVGAVTVGMTHMGFVVESEIPLPSGGNGGGCSSCCGGCGRSRGWH